MTKPLARIAAVYPTAGWRAGERKGLAMGVSESAGARSSSGEPDEAPEKKCGYWKFSGLEHMRASGFESFRIGCSNIF